MITALVQFKLPSPISREKAAELFQASAPNYRNMAGLIRKYYLLSEDGGTAGGVYLWESKQDADKIYTAEWRQMIKQRYGAEPSITYFQSPVIVDNVTGEITTDG